MTRPLDEYMEQRVFDLRELKIIKLHNLPDDGMPPAVVVQRNGIDMVFVFTTTPTALEVSVTSWVDGEQAVDLDHGAEIVVRIERPVERLTGT